jgi:hypothetical protein
MCLLRGTFCPRSVYMCFVWIWEQTAIISLYSINWLVFITETECVYCAMRAETLHKIHISFSLQRVNIFHMKLVLYEVWQIKYFRYLSCMCVSTCSLSAGYLWVSRHTDVTSSFERNILLMLLKNDTFYNHVPKHRHVAIFIITSHPLSYDGQQTQLRIVRG